MENIRDILIALQEKLKAATSHLEMEFPYFMSKTGVGEGKFDGLHSAV